MVFLLTVVFIVIILPLSAHMFYSDVIYFSVCLRCCVFALILASIHFPLLLSVASPSYRACFRRDCFAFYPVSLCCIKGKRAELGDIEVPP